MEARTSTLLGRRWLSFCFLWAVLLPSTVALGAVDRPASIEASGQGAIFDVKATAAGTLRVGTKAGRVGDRWRVTIAKVNGAGAVSNVGSGSSTAFSGYASMAVAANVQYLVIVTWDRPLPGTLPAAVTVRFAGATDATSPPVVQLNGSALSSIVPRPIHWAEVPASCPGDGAEIGCDALVACVLNPAGDTDAFKVTVPANSDLSVSVAGPYPTYWKLIAPNGTPVNPSGCLGQCEVALAAAGAYTVQVYNPRSETGVYVLSLLGISSAYRCGAAVTPGGAASTGKFDLTGDTDAFQLNGVLAGQSYNIGITGPPYTFWKIFDPDGVAVNPGGCSGSCQVTLPKAGGYTIEVYNDLGLTGSYRLTTQKVGS